MHASNIKSWNSLSGDYVQPEELDYVKTYDLAKVEQRGFVKKVTVIFSLVALGAIVIILELLTRV